MFSKTTVRRNSCVFASLVAGALASAALTGAEASDAADRINRIINGLDARSMVGESYPTRLEIPVVGERRKGGPTYRAYYANFDYSVSIEVHFEVGSAKITPSQRWILDEVGAALQSRRLKGARFLIVGHTDADGDRGDNQWLSEQRARSVKAYLTRNFDIKPHRLVALGFGEERLLTPDDPYSGRNRRVEIAVLEDDSRRVAGKTFRLPSFDGERTEYSRRRY